MNQTSAKVIDIRHEHLDLAVEVLALAFEHDPLIHYFFSGYEAEHLSLVKELFRYICERRLAHRWPILGRMIDTQLVGVACPTPPERESLPRSDTNAYEQRFRSGVGEVVINRIDKFTQVVGKYSPGQPHFYLTAMGVHPQAQATGHGRAILEAVHTLSEAHPTSIGVGLDTENPANLPFYEHFGYHIVAKTQLEDVDIWCLFRPNGTDNNIF